MSALASSGVLVLDFPFKFLILALQAISLIPHLSVDLKIYFLIPAIYLPYCIPMAADKQSVRHRLRGPVIYGLCGKPQPQIWRIPRYYVGFSPPTRCPRMLKRCKVSFLTYYSLIIN